LAKKLSEQFENNRQSILQTTSRLFGDKGIAETSFADISRAVKLSKGTIYYYYPSKDHLIYEVTEYHLEQTTDSILTWLETIDESLPLSDTLTLLLQSIFNTKEKCRLHICLAGYAIMDNDGIRNMINERAAKWHAMVGVGLQKIGESKPLAEALFAMLDSIIFKRAMGAAPVDEAQIGAALSRYV